MQTQQSQQPHKTRAEVLRARVVIRLAVDEAGPAIGALLGENGIELPGATWAKVFPHWLIACDGDAVIGCVQVTPSKPVAWLQFLCVKPSAPFKLRAIAIRKLTAGGMATCHAAGCAYVAGMLEAQNRKFEDVLKKLNFVSVSDFRMLAKRLT